jgi:hypothetical protein
MVDIPRAKKECVFFSGCWLRDPESIFSVGTIKIFELLAGIFAFSNIIFMFHRVEFYICGYRVRQRDKKDGAINCGR